ncbi:unnamed protein product [Rotaria sp. Silwood2]|nr:unnamed protein product [Rotaria sp. Silwood2]CAF3089886.1 unnamed protein product [Rotaria sp. Silwood2]CAF3429571.1 unnamed protein product [Rotaria sp. Silwood2]CAF4401113.1 unnamed protein product [Rotaria sp. Silwood2]CAF4490241.1 unnamed protein product [Rotaria sp. Silwood2]
MDVIVDKDTDSLIICDYENTQVVRWPRQGGTSGETIIPNIDCLSLMIDNQGFLYISSPSENVIRRWRVEDNGIGTVIAGGNGAGDCLNQLNRAFHIFVNRDHSIYGSDCSNHRAVYWMKNSKEGIVVTGGQGEGNHLTQCSCPHGVIADQLDTVYVAKLGNN